MAENSKPQEVGKSQQNVNEEESNPKESVQQYLESLYKRRAQLCHCYVGHKKNLGMHTTQGVESMNNLIKHYHLDTAKSPLDVLKASIEVQHRRYNEDVC